MEIRVKSESKYLFLFLHFTFSNTADIFKVFNVKYLNRKNGKKKFNVIEDENALFSALSGFLGTYVIKTAKG